MMTAAQWIRLAVELVADLVTGKLEKPDPPKPEVAPLPHLDVERQRRASHGHMTEVGAGFAVWCRGPHAPHRLCTRCQTHRRD